MKALAFIIGLSACMLSSCADNLNETLTDDECLLLTGHTCEAMRTISSTASASASPTLLATGSHILVHTTGGLQLTDEVLTYQSHRWEPEQPLRWTDPTVSTQLTALYPVYPNRKYEAANLYANQTLADVLYVHETYPAGSSMHLQFKHLFSQIHFQLSANLKKRLKKLELTCPYTVTRIDPVTAQCELSQTHPQTITWLSSSNPVQYSTLVPPCKNATFTLRLTTDKQTYQTSLTIPQLESGYAYTYAIKTPEATPGIATVEDWIAFNKLMNDPWMKVYKGKTLDDFRKTEGGVTTYYLLHDLDFTGIDPKLTKTIPSDINKQPYFPYRFDGQGHTLSHLTLKPHRGGGGILTGIDSTGCLKNLHLKECTVYIDDHEDSSSQGIGLLAGINYGTIDNCSVDNCQIIVIANTKEHKASTGGLVGKSSGKIYNCSAHRIKISYKSRKDSNHPCGGLVGLLNGELYNCYAARITINNPLNDTGGICGNSENAKVENCYLYQIMLSKKKGLLAGKAVNSVFNFMYYEESSIPLLGKKTNSHTNHATPYQPNFTSNDSHNIYDLLNSWVKKNASGENLTGPFSQWKKGDSQLPAELIH